MKILVILAHPQEGSFNHAIAESVAEQLSSEGHEILYHDLYAEKFDSLLPGSEIPRDAELTAEVAAHCEELSEADGVIVIHPNWWGQPPAILKGWIDRVIRPGVAYEFLENDKGEGVPKGLLKAKTAVVFNTSNTESEREQKVFKDPLETIWKNCIFDLCGVENFHRRMFNIVVTSSQEQREGWLNEACKLVTEAF